MHLIKTFLIGLLIDIDNAKQNHSKEIPMDSFPSFLATLSDKSLEYYSEISGRLIDKELEPTSEDMQIGIMFYGFILKKIELHKIRMDADGAWAVALFLFLTMEKFYRMGLIDNYSGYLYEGKPLVKPNEKMKNLGDHLIMNMSEKDREKYNIK